MFARGCLHCPVQSAALFACSRCPQAKAPSHEGTGMADLAIRLYKEPGPYNVTFRVVSAQNPDDPKLKLTPLLVNVQTCPPGFEQRAGKVEWTCNMVSTLLLLLLLLLTRLSLLPVHMHSWPDHMHLHLITCTLI